MHARIRVDVSLRVQTDRIVRKVKDDDREY